MGRPRPPLAWAVPEISAHGYAFPSGHASQAAAIYGLIAVLLAGQVRGWAGKVTVWTVAVLAAGAVGFSRLYLGVHWLTDVLAAWALGAGWLAAVLVAAGTWTRARASRPGRAPTAAPATAHAAGSPHDPPVLPPVVVDGRPARPAGVSPRRDLTEARKPE